MRDVEAPARRRPLRAIDLFCGAGGLSQGLRAAGYAVSYALDHDADSCATYRRNHEGTYVDERSITDVTPTEIAELAGGPVDVIVGGPSCQSFSTAGRKNGWVRKGDPRNDLWKRMLAAVAHLKPKAFLLENVPGMLYFKRGEFGAVVLDEFEKLGYTVSKKILLAADYGVPQRRRRLFVVGLLGDEPFEWPAETHLGGWRRDTLKLWEKHRQERGLLRHIRTWEAIGDLPPVADRRQSVVLDETRATHFTRLLRTDGQVPDHEPVPMPAEHLELIRHVPAGGTWRDVPAHILPDRFRGMRRTDSTTLLGRLAPDLPAYTITTQFNNVTTGCFTHPFEDRSLTVREAARLQTFPDSYRFDGATASKCRQVGNAVPPVLAHVLVYEIAKSVLGPVPARAHHRAPSAIQPSAAMPAPPATNASTRQRMKSQKRKNTGAEVLLRKELHAAGLRFRVDKKPVEGLRRTADVVFVGARVAVFVHGCFWHGCPEHFRQTKSNTQWWADKVAVNKARDEETTARLEAAGWKVIVVWEHEHPSEAARRVASAVRAARSTALLTRA